MTKKRKEQENAEGIFEQHENKKAQHTTLILEY